MDKAIADFKNDKEELAPSEERLNKLLRISGEDPELFKEKKIDSIKRKRRK